jgi:hypothetical protein
MNGPLEKELDRPGAAWMAFVLILDIGVLIYSQIRVELDSSQHQGSGSGSGSGSGFRWSRIIFNLCFKPKIVPLNDDGSNNCPYSFRTLRLIVGLCTISGCCAIAFILSFANFSFVTLISMCCILWFNVIPYVMITNNHNLYIYAKNIITKVLTSPPAFDVLNV